MRFLKTCCALFPALLITTCAAADEESPDLYFLNWSEYIAPDTIKNFEQETGIKVHYSRMDSNEILEAKLFAGDSGYDIIVPSLHILKKLGDAGLLLPLDKSQLPNLVHLDPDKMARIAEVDLNNTYGIPYMELSTGIGYSEDKLKKILGENFEADSWDLLFKPEIASKINKACGIAILDSASDMICSAMVYLGLNPQDPDPAAYVPAEKLLKDAVHNVIYMQNSQYSNDLASGEICLSAGWSGDIQRADQNSREAGNGRIRYIIPKEGALMGYDMLAIPKNSRHPNNAHKFLNYLLRPEVIADITNHTRYANPNRDAIPLIDKEITSNDGIYYPPEMLKRMHIVVPDAKIQKAFTKIWTNVRMNAGE